MTTPYLRWMIRRDIPAVLAIEQASFTPHWDEEDFIHCLRQRNCIGMVAEVREQVAGYMIYELHKNRLHVLNFAVDPPHRRRGVGRAMIQKLFNKLSPLRRTSIVLDVRETNLEAQKFYRACGFLATAVLRGHYIDTGEDAYRMRLKLGSQKTEGAMA